MENIQQKSWRPTRKAVKLSASIDPDLEGEVLDISETGLKIKFNRPIQTNQNNVKLKILFDENIHAVFRVVWEQTDPESNSYIYGGTFPGLGEKEQELIKKMLQALQSFEYTRRSISERIKYYIKRAKEIDYYLSRNPEHWGKYQSEFNVLVNSIFIDILNFDKENFIKGFKNRTDKLKNLFVKRIRKVFLKGFYNRWSLEKPYGYAGDYKIIDSIYLNSPETVGMERLHDNYFQMSAISMAVRNRKEDFKKIILRLINERKGEKIRIMDLACGPCREIKEVLSSKEVNLNNIVFDCYDSELNALAYAKEQLKDFENNVNFIELNALKVGISKDINKLLGHKYDLIYSTGLFDYLNHRVAVRVIKNLKKALNDNGLLAIANVRDKFNNSSVYYMEWVGDWNLIYRNDEEFKIIFQESGFTSDQLKTIYEQQGIILYVLAKNCSDNSSTTGQ